MTEIERAYREGFGDGWTPSPGDVVQLKCGGPAMVVTAVEEHMRRVCVVWHHAGELRVDHVQPCALQKGAPPTVLGGGL